MPELNDNDDLRPLAPMHGTPEMVPSRRAEIRCVLCTPPLIDGEHYWIKESPGGQWQVGRRDSNQDELGGWWIIDWDSPTGAYEIGPHIPRPGSLSATR